MKFSWYISQFFFKFTFLNPEGGGCLTPVGAIGHTNDLNFCGGQFNISVIKYFWW
jgi:hypothetical protein